MMAFDFLGGKHDGYPKPPLLRLQKGHTAFGYYLTTRHLSSFLFVQVLLLREDVGLCDTIGR